MYEWLALLAIALKKVPWSVRPGVRACAVATSCRTPRVTGLHSPPAD
jgi:hypothetical protein